MSPQKSDIIPSDQIPLLHELYCRLTGQTLLLNRFDRQRQWYEIIRAGFTAQDVERVIKYLQREILKGRRNPGALRLSNLLQLDRFEEDLNLSRIRLQRSMPARRDPVPAAPPVSLTDDERQQFSQALRQFRLRLHNHGATTHSPTAEPDPT